MSITQGFANARSLVRRAQPRVQAVWGVKVGKARELSMCSMASSSRGGIGMVGSAAAIVAMKRVDDR